MTTRGAGFEKALKISKKRNARLTFNHSAVISTSGKKNPERRTEANERNLKQMGMFWQSTEKGGVSQSRFVKRPWVPGVGSRCSQSPPIDFKFSGTPEGHWVSRYFPQTLNKAQAVFSALPVSGLFE